MKKEQFKLIVKKINIKQERLQAVEDVIFTDATSFKAERKYGLVIGVISRDVDRVKSLYEWAVKLIKKAGE